MNTRFSESVVEDAALAWLEALGYAVLHGPDIAGGKLSRDSSHLPICLDDGSSPTDSGSHPGVP